MLCAGVMSSQSDKQKVTHISQESQELNGAFIRSERETELLQKCVVIILKREDKKKKSIYFSIHQSIDLSI